MPLNNDVIGLYNDPNAVKILAISSKENGHHLIHVNSMMATNPNTIILANVKMKEADKNLIQAMTSGTLVSVLSAATIKKALKAYQVRCTVKEFQTTGPLYDKFLDQLKTRSADLEGVWILEPVEVIDRTPGPNFGKTII